MSRENPTINSLENTEANNAESPSALWKVEEDADGQSYAVDIIGEKYPIPEGWQMRISENERQGLFAVYLQGAGAREMTVLHVGALSGEKAKESRRDIYQELK